ncbi:MAG: hypothetical protein KJO11_12615 [Gemmatimonadetes bacterium]|nr:hypothetical protein [Gemmatimonadota bacterium]
MTPRGVAVRLFLTLWTVYAVHFATDFGREHFLVVSMVDDGTFALDPYLGMHNDIFQLPNGRSYHGANPGVSMMAAVPYVALKPVVDRVVNRELANRSGEVTAVYDDPRPARQAFYRQARENGWDIRFGFVSIITAVLFMAPLTAWSAAVLYRTLAAAGLPGSQALGGALVYGLGTPVFYRTAYLNQNLAVAVFALVAFCILWDPGNRGADRRRVRNLQAGLLGGLALLCDYSGAVALGLLGLYAVARRSDEVPLTTAIKDSLWFAAGAVGPILVLWYYQWAAFGNFIRPPQHHMPPVEWSDLGYQGVTGPQAELFSLLLTDPRYGLFVAAPFLVLGLLAPWWTARRKTFIATREVGFALLVALAYTVFFSAVHYTRLQYIHGIRYILPAVPFLFLATAVVLRRIPRVVTALVVTGSVAFTWAQSMARIQEQETSLLAPVQRVVLEGLQLPALETFERMAGQYAPSLQGSGVSAIPALLATAVTIALIWLIRRPGRPLADVRVDPE